jgi:hypothetical protein
MFEYSTIQEQNKAGEVRVSATSRGETLQCYNYSQKRWTGVGSISGATYEKVANVLKVVKGNYCPSFTLTEAELQAARDCGASFMRVISDGVTYSISLNDFEKYAESYINSFYGNQLAVSVEHFAQTGKTKKRNKRMDSPPLPHGEGYHRPQPQQLDLFQPTRSTHYDEFGNFVGGVS